MSTSETNPSSPTSVDHNRSVSFDMDVETGNGTAPPHKSSFDNIDRDRMQGILENRGRNRLRDPFGLGTGLKTSDQLKEISRQKRGRRLVKHYKAQNELIESLLKPMELHSSEAKKDVQDSRLPVKIAIWASLISNVALCILQLYAAISSGSLSLLTTGVDSVFDILSNILLYYMHRKAAKLDVNKWPVGGNRLEPIANVIYGSLMCSANLIVTVESVQQLLTHPDELKPFHVASLAAVAAALGVKFLLFLYSYPLRDKSSQVDVLWEDHRNDLFINGFAILTSAGGSKLRWWLDPMGAMIIATGVIALWVKTIYEQFELLAGKTAPKEFVQLIVYKVLTFSDEIEGVDTVRAYHSGPDYVVEVDVVMPGDTPLWKAHDISQLLQDKLEILPRVERAYVHVDHETTHAPEHRKLKQE